jgi:hypothetical protein
MNLDFGGLIRTLSYVWIFSLVALMASMLDEPAKASTWHSDISLHGYYCPGGGKRVHLEDCPRRNGGAPARARPNAAVRAACSGDAKRFCSAVINDLGARRACMRSHREQLSTACKAALAKQFGPRATKSGN